MLKLRRSRLNRERGITLLEVMLAGAVLVVGFMGLLGLILSAIASNNRSKFDSTATMLAQAVVENVNTVLARPGANLATCNATNPTCVDYFPDCAGNNQVIDSSVGGAALVNGQIDYSQVLPSSDHHHMDYVVCNVQSQAIYDVRWSVQTLDSPVGSMYLVTVGAKPKAQVNSPQSFAFPVVLRTYVAN